MSTTNNKKLTGMERMDVGLDWNGEWNKTKNHWKYMVFQCRFGIEIGSIESVFVVPFYNFPLCEKLVFRILYNV